MSNDRSSAIAFFSFAVFLAGLFVWGARSQRSLAWYPAVIRRGEAPVRYWMGQIFLLVMAIFFMVFAALAFIGLHRVDLHYFH